MSNHARRSVTPNHRTVALLLATLSAGVIVAAGACGSDPHSTPVNPPPDQESGSTSGTTGSVQPVKNPSSSSVAAATAGGAGGGASVAAAAGAGGGSSTTSGGMGGSSQASSTASTGGSPEPVDAGAPDSLAQIPGLDGGLFDAAGFDASGWVFGDAGFPGWQVNDAGLAIFPDSGLPQIDASLPNIDAGFSFDATPPVEPSFDAGQFVAPVINAPTIPTIQAPTAPTSQPGQTTQPDTESPESDLPTIPTSLPTPQPLAPPN